MTAPEDIVVRLHRHRCVTGIRTVIDDAADEIERLRTQLEMWQDGNIMSELHHDEIERLRAELVSKADELAATLRDLRKVQAERDEARAEVTFLRPSVCLGAQTASEYAKTRGWDCFKEPANAP